MVGRYERRDFIMRLFMLTAFLLSLWAMPYSAVDAQTADPFYVVTCADGRQIVGYNFTFEGLEAGSSVRVTLLGSTDFDPIFANITDSANPQCVNNSTSAANSAVQLPGAGILNANDFSAQQTLQPNASGTLRLLVGGAAGQTGTFALIVDRLNIRRAGETDRMRVDVPRSLFREWINVFMISGNESLDPLMNLYLAEGSVRANFTCDNSGTGTCPGVPSLADQGAIVSRTDVYQADSFDAGLMGAYQQENLLYEFRDALGTNTGDYAVVVVGTAPGAVVDTTYICDAVDITIAGSSATYNPAYALEGAADGDPSTFWVTAVPAGSSEGGAVNGFIVLALEEPTVINKIRLNGYYQSPEPELRANSLRRFAVRFPGPNGELLSAIETDLLQQPGYQSFSFLPAEVEEVGLVLLANYGGTLFTVVDVQLCAAP